MKMRKLVAITAGILAGFLGAASASHSAGLLEGKTLTMIVPHTTSGLYGQYAQLMAPYIAKELKASNVRVEHRTGAGGIVGSNLVWKAAPNGMTFGLSSGTSLLIAQLAGSEGVQFEATKFTYLGRPTADERVITVGGNSPIKTFEDIRKLGRPFTMPSQGTDEDFYAMAILAKALGFSVKFVTGYQGNADTTLAVIKGDGDGHINSWPSSVPNIKAGDKRPILTVGLQRNPEYPDVPTALEFAKGPESERLIRALIDIQSLHRIFFGPPGMSEAVTKELRDAIWATLNNPVVIEAAIKLQSPLKPVDGATQQKTAAEIYKASSDIPPILKEALASIQ